MADDRGYEGAAVYCIRVRGLVGERWSAWFGGMAIQPLANGETVLRGQVVDQAALHGILHKIRDMHLPLLSVERV
jgi:hypothetical protein